MQYTSCPSDISINSSQTNRFVYFKQNTMLFNKVDGYQIPAKNTILINPNFKSNNFYVNPNFTGTVSSKPSVHINPNVFKANYYAATQATTATQKTVVASNGLNCCNMQKINNNALAKKINTCIVNVSKPLVSTPTKLVRAPVRTVQQTSTNVINSFAQKQRIVKSKYSIVKTNVTDPKKSVVSLQANNSCKILSKFKIDNRIIAAGSTNRKNLYKDKNVSSVSSKRRDVSYIRIGGVLYKKSRLKLQRSTSFENKNQKKKLILSKPRIHKIINKNGIRYQVNINRRTLKRMSDVSLRKVIIPKKKKIFLTPVAIKKNFVKGPSIKRKFNQKIPLSSNKLKKCNVPCIFYRKFGRCRGKIRGTCNKVHDPSHIIICPRFLQGACVNKTCLLSHNVSPEKMPTCKFFLEGLCSREDCPYLHVKVSPKADICLDFLKGYCKKAKECDRRHQYLCPDFEKTGTCPRRKCTYPHGNMVRSVTQKKQKLSVKQHSVKRKVKDKIDEIPNEKNLVSIGSICNTRYYTDSLTGHDSKGSELDIRRSKLDKLPCFIPLADCSEASC